MALPLLLGLVIGTLPLILHNVTAPPGQDSLAVLRKLQTLYSTNMDRSHIPWIQQPLGAFFVSLPIGSGYAAACQISEPWGRIGDYAADAFHLVNPGLQPLCVEFKEAGLWL